MFEALAVYLALLRSDIFLPSFCCSMLDFLKYKPGDQPLPAASPAPPGGARAVAAGKLSAPPRSPAAPLPRGRPWRPGGAGRRRWDSSPPWPRQQPRRRGEAASVAPCGRDGDGTGTGTGPPPVPARRVRGGSPEPLRGKGLAASGGRWGDGGLGRARPSRGAALKGEERRRPPQHGCEGKGQRSAVWGGSPRNRL